MKRTHNKLEDSDDDVDNLPLKYISSYHKNDTSIKELKRYSIHACEFCEKILENRYDYFIHNAKHIIIPLIKMLPHYCAECGLYCISEEEFDEHISLKHNTFVKQKWLSNNDCKIKVSDGCNDRHMKEESNDDEKLKCLIKKEKDILGNGETDNILKNFVMNCKVDVEKFVPPWLYRSDEEDIKSKNVFDAHEIDIKNDVIKCRPSIESNNEIKTRIVSFKIVDFTPSTGEDKEIKSELDNLKIPASDTDYSSEFSELHDDPIVILAPVKKEIVTECEHDSIHFDDLMKPGMFYCKRCFMRFPNRFEVIVHEAVHLDMSKVAPECYKVKHKKHCGSTIPFPSKTVSKNDTCDRCDEEISDKKLHAKTCFQLYCGTCAKGFNNRTLLTTHEGKCCKEATVNMCDACLYMRKRPKHLRYFGIMRFNKLDVKRMCHWCGKLCDDISLVTLVTKQRLADRIRFEGESENVRVPESSAFSKVNDGVKRRNNGTSERGAGRGSKVLSNRERLKLIQNRLKLMKK